jgi:hypothetical protein
MMQNDDGLIIEKGKKFDVLQHAIAACVIARLYEITLDVKFLEPLQKAVSALLKHRTADGAWPVERSGESSVVATVYALDTIRSAQSAGLEVPGDVFSDAAAWLNKIEANDCTHVSATGLAAARALAEMWAGKKKSSPGIMKNIDFILENPPDNASITSTYYMDTYLSSLAAYFMCEFGDKYLPSWSRLVGERLFSGMRRGPVLDGSSDPPKASGPFSGRLVSTALANSAFEFVSQTGIGRGFKYYGSCNFDAFYDTCILDDIDPMRTKEPHTAAFAWGLRNVGFWDVCARCAFVLGMEKDLPRAFARRLVDALGDKDAFVRANAVRALGNIGFSEAADEIKKLENDTSPFVRAMIKDALMKLSRP